MLFQKNKTAKADFARGILITFGKLDEGDIRAIDGRLERLSTLLTDRYGWTDPIAREMAERFIKEKLPPTKSGSRSLGLIRRGIELAGIGSRRRTPESDEPFPIPDAIAPVGATD